MNFPISKNCSQGVGVVRGVLLVEGEVRQQRTVGIEGGHRDTRRSGFEEPARRKGLCHWGVKRKKREEKGALLNRKKRQGE
jgi:hypothetical protein